MQKKILIAILLSSLALLPMQVSAALIPSISIDNGALYTMVMPVTLYLSYSANGGSVMQDCRYSNDGVFDTEPWVSYTSTAAWALDPGTGQKTVHYQVRDTLGSTYQASDTIYLIADNPCSYAANGMYCCARSGPCVGTEADIFHMSSRMNAHAELPSQTNYPYRVCCGGITGLGGSCTGPGPSESAINLSATYNAHAEKNTMANYANGACLSAPAGIIDCSYTTGACSSLGPNYACLGTISADMNAHVSDCDGIGDYSEKICCSYAEPPCELKSATILGVCGGGALPACEVGESVSMTATTTGNCSSVTSFEIDAAGGACTVLLTNSTPAVSAGSVSGLWTIASIPTACSAVTVTASAARLYNISGLVASNVTPYVTGSFTFKDVVEPETTLNPYVPDPTNITTPTYTGSATDASSNIASVQYRIDGGAWLNAIASDGNFNSPSEAFTRAPKGAVISS